MSTTTLSALESRALDGFSPVALSGLSAVFSCSRSGSLDLRRLCSVCVHGGCNTAKAVTGCHCGICEFPLTVVCDSLSGFKPKYKVRCSVITDCSFGDFEWRSMVFSRNTCRMLDKLNR